MEGGRGGGVGVSGERQETYLSTGVCARDVPAGGVGEAVGRSAARSGVLGRSRHVSEAQRLLGCLSSPEDPPTPPPPPAAPPAPPPVISLPHVFLSSVKPELTRSIIAFLSLIESEKVRTVQSTKSKITARRRGHFSWMVMTS